MRVGGRRPMYTFQRGSESSDDECDTDSEIPCCYFEHDLLEAHLAKPAALPCLGYGVCCVLRPSLDDLHNELPP